MPPAKKPVRHPSELPAPPTGDPVAPSPQESRYPQFTLATMFRFMLIASVLAAVLGGLLRGKQALEKSGSGSATFVVIALVAPLAVLIAVSVVANGGAAAARVYLRYRRRRK